MVPGEELFDPDLERERQRAELPQAHVLAPGFEVGDRGPADPGALGEPELRETAIRSQLPHARSDAPLEGFREPAHRPTRSSIPTL